MKITIKHIRELERTINETEEQLQDGASNPVHSNAVREMIDIFRQKHISVHLLIDILTFTKSPHISFYGQRTLNSLRRLEK